MSVFQATVASAQKKEKVTQSERSVAHRISSAILDVNFCPVGDQ